MQRVQAWDVCNTGHLTLIHELAFEHTSNDLDFLIQLFLKGVDFTSRSQKVRTVNESEFSWSFRHLAFDSCFRQSLLSQSLLCHEESNSVLSQCLSNFASFLNWHTVEIGQYQRYRVFYNRL